MSELYHHGVEGMSWGKRNGPPYPLNAKGRASLAKQKSSIVKRGSGSGDIIGSKKKQQVKPEILARVVSKRIKRGIELKLEEVAPESRNHKIYQEYRRARNEYKKYEKSKDTGTLDSPEAIDALDKYDRANYELAKAVESREIKLVPVYSDNVIYDINNKTKNYSDLTIESINRAKEKAIRDGNIEEAYNNRQHYTDNELKSVKARYHLNTEIKKLKDKDINNGMDKVSEIADKLDTVNKLTNAVAVAAGNTVKIYNAVGAFAALANGNKKFNQIPINNLAQYQKQNEGNKKKKK